MNEIDKMSVTLLEQAKRFYEKSLDTTEQEAKSAFLNAALVLSFSSLESHINSISDDFEHRKDFSIHEKALMFEKEVRISSGKFVLTNTLKMYRLEDRIEFLYSKFANKPINKSSQWWARLQQGIMIRNKLSHPKEFFRVNDLDVKNTIDSILILLDNLYKAIYKKKYPYINRGITSNMVF